MRAFVSLIGIFVFLIFPFNFSNSSPPKGDECRLSTDCMKLNHCNEELKQCEHDYIFPFNGIIVIGLFCIAVGSALSNAGGTGGGGLLIPILLLVLNFYTHEAIPISKLMIFSGAFTSFLLGFRQKHPARNSITIDYNIPFLLIPMLLFGTMVGVTLNKMTPPWLILVLLTLVLTINTYKTLSKGRSLYQKESQEIKKIQQGKEARDGLSIIENNFNNNKLETKELIEMESRADGKASQMQSIPSGMLVLELGGQRNSNSIMKEEGKLDKNYSLLSGQGNLTKEELLKIEEKKDLRKCPLKKMLVIFFCYSVMLIINFLKGSENMKSIINVEMYTYTPLTLNILFRCTVTYWMVYFSYLPIAILVTFFIHLHIKKEYQHRLRIQYPFNKTDIIWKGFIFIKFPMYSFLSGLLAGMLGIGGGTVLGPLLLQVGLHPMVSTATSNFLVLFTSSSTSIQFLILGMMNRDYGIACVIASSIGSLIGTLVIQKVINKTKRNSYLVFVLGSVLLVSTVLVPGHTLMQLIDKIKQQKNIWKFNSPC